MAVSKIKELRKLAGLTQEDVASILRVNRATVSKYETGAIELPIQQAKLLSSFLGVDWTELYSKDDQGRIYTQEYTGLSPTASGKLHERMNYDLVYNAVDRHELDALISSPRFNYLLSCLSDYRTCCNFVRFSPKKAMEATTLEEANRNWKDAFNNAKIKGDCYRDAIRTLELILKDIEQQCNGGDNNAVNEKKDD